METMSSESKYIFYIIYLSIYLSIFIDSIRQLFLIIQSCLMYKDDNVYFCQMDFNTLSLIVKLYALEILNFRCKPALAASKLGQNHNSNLMPLCFFVIPCKYSVAFVQIVPAAYISL